MKERKKEKLNASKDERNKDTWGKKNSKDL
jgi:hypothetical protein